jgi:hypothetical protein
LNPPRPTSALKGAAGWLAPPPPSANGNPLPPVIVKRIFPGPGTSEPLRVTDLTVAVTAAAALPDTSRHYPANGHSNGVSGAATAAAPLPIASASPEISREPPAHGRRYAVGAIDPNDIPPPPAGAITQRVATPGSQLGRPETPLPPPTPAMRREEEVDFLTRLETRGQLGPLQCGPIDCSPSCIGSACAAPLRCFVDLTSLLTCQPFGLCLACLDCAVCCVAVPLISCMCCLWTCETPRETVWGIGRAGVMNCKIATIALACIPVRTATLVPCCLANCCCRESVVNCEMSAYKEMSDCCYDCCLTKHVKQKPLGALPRNETVFNAIKESRYTLFVRTLSRTAEVSNKSLTSSNTQAQPARAAGPILIKARRGSAKSSAARPPSAGIREASPAVVRAARPGSARQISSRPGSAATSPKSIPPRPGSAVASPKPVALNRQPDILTIVHEKP